MKSCVNKFHPELNKVYFINRHSLFHILEGNGSIEVDFKSYLDWHDKLIYLDKGQYIKFLSDNFVVRRIEFEDSDLFKSQEVRVLFKHLVSLGYINYQECEDCQQFLDSTVLGKVKKDIIDVSSDQWFCQNPFGAAQEEYQVIFDVKELIDEHYVNHLSSQEIVDLLSLNGYHVHDLFRNKLGLSIKRLWANKMVLESKKDIAFTDKTIQEVAYEKGFKDPAYFNRFFKRETGQQPVEFRKASTYEGRNRFAEDVFELIRAFHKEKHSLEFYAGQMNLSIKTLSRKVKKHLNTSLGLLIRDELVASAKQRLKQGLSVKEIAHELHFEEANHFTRFFKNSTGITPTVFQKKYN